MRGMPRELVSSILRGEKPTHTQIYKLYYTSWTQKFSFEHHTWKLRVVLKKLGLVYQDEVQEVWSEGLKFPNSVLSLCKVW